MIDIPFDEHGLLLRRTAVARGYDDDWLRRMVKCGALIRIRHGAYADPRIWAAAGAVGQHVLLSRAVMQQYDDRVALSHASAHLLRGGPDWGLTLDTVNITNLFGRGDRKKAGITHHRGAVRVGDVSRVDDYWITAPARTAVETAAQVGLVPAVCVLDWTLNQGLATREELDRYSQLYMREWPDTLMLPVAVGRSHPGSETVGETRTRLALENTGFHPIPQWKVFDPSGRLAGRVDLLLEAQGVMVEFDGRIKYGRLLKPGQTINDVIRAERAREVLLEELTGLRMLRLTWPDLDDEQRLAARVWSVASQRRAG